MFRPSTPIGSGHCSGRWTSAPAEYATPNQADALSATSVGPSVNFVNADEAWALGYSGQGAVVAGADTGVRWTHESIKSRYRGWNAVTGQANHNYNWHDGIKWQNAFCPGNSTAPCDDDQIVPVAGAGGHGTHTMGTMVGVDGAGQAIGMAPDAEVGRLPQHEQRLRRGADVHRLHAVVHRADRHRNGANPDPSKAPDVVNNSWGCVEVCAPPLLKDAADASRAAGIFYAVSAGNDNQFFLGLTMACNTINFPLATYDSVFTVGARRGAQRHAVRHDRRLQQPRTCVGQHDRRRAVPQAGHHRPPARTYARPAPSATTPTPRTAARAWPARTSRVWSP